MIFRHFKPGSVVRAYRRYGDFVASGHMRGLGDPLAELEADDAGGVMFENLPAGCPLWIAGTGIDGSPRVVSAQVPGHFAPGPEVVPLSAARQTQSQNDGHHVKADERSDVRSTAVHGPRTSRDAKPKPLPFEPEQLARLSPEQREKVKAIVDEAAPRNPRPRHQAPRPGEAGGPELPKGPGYDDELPPAA